MKRFILLAALLAFPLALSAQTRQPGFAALDMNGNRVDTAAMRGKVVVINLWFIKNCPNCIEEIKLLNEIVDTYKDNKDVVFLGPNADMIILGKFGTPNKKGEISMPFPMHYVLDRNGNIITKTQGIKASRLLAKS